MKQAKVKKCKYLKCNKNTHSETSLFCLEHSRKLKDKVPNKDALAVAASAVLTAAPIIISLLNKNKK